MADQSQTVTIDGKAYELDKLSENAQQQLANLRACDEELARLQRQFSIAQAARVTYSNLLENALKEGDASGAAAKNTTSKASVKSSASSRATSSKAAPAKTASSKTAAKSEGASAQAEAPAKKGTRAKKTTH